eukprot:COSAG06_NODE_32721_length_501_cov_1.253731_2_plen_27_part_01
MRSRSSLNSLGLTRGDIFAANYGSIVG